MTAQNSLPLSRTEIIIFQIIWEPVTMLIKQLLCHKHMIKENLISFIAHFSLHILVHCTIGSSRFLNFHAQNNQIKGTFDWYQLQMLLICPLNADFNRFFHSLLVNLLRHEGTRRATKWSVINTSLAVFKVKRLIQFSRWFFIWCSSFDVIRVIKTNN